MPTVTFLEADTRTVVQAPAGISLMEAATRNGIAGVVAACGGGCSCATCMVHLDADWFARVGAPDDNEQMMIEFGVDPRETSRLSCQIVLTEEMDGLVVEVPDNQV
ncbi:2Fe-2S iron-sulfur cluster binding domain-containing protein [Sagittula sp. NFXS13]|uniref:2Fe-2S ferredoxin n=1 Tax=Sagittula marina TaxID=943940 RepID=A0A7W6DQK3_9RHOB|nr:2Fe-2S iron-sulfur cluster-binding protein [Sagittula marina]MBB3987385.1 2Fe-2S ferredoxin [Sagittula marina]